MRLVVTLNGTGENSWHRMNLRQNPFPQVPRAELEAAMAQLNSLDGDPITGPEDIRSRLSGWSDEFVEGCIERFVPGQRTRFSVEFEEAV